MSGNVAWRLRLKDVGAASRSLIPALQVEIGLTLSEGTRGESVTVPEGFQEMRVTGVSAVLSLPDEAAFGGSTFIAFGGTSPGQFYPQSLRPNKEEVSVTLLFPLSMELLRAIEERRAGKKPSFQVEADVQTNIVIERPYLMVPENPPNLGASNALGWDALKKGATFKETRVEPFPSVRLWLMGDRLEPKPLVVELSRWIEILQEFNYASYRLYEVPAHRSELTFAADEHIASAFRHFQRGDWRNSLGEARAANESLIRAIREAANPVHSDKRAEAEEKMQRVVKTSEVLYEAMLENQGAWLSVGAAGSHPSRPGLQVERADAELALNQVLAFRQYVGRRFPAEAAKAAI